MEDVEYGQNESIDGKQNNQNGQKIIKSDTQVAGVDFDLISKDLKTARIISPAYASSKSELLAILLYTYQIFQFSYQKREDIAKQLEEISIQEMTHLEWLGQMLIRLGVAPIYTHYPPIPANFFTTRFVPYNSNQIMMIKIDLQGEKQAIADYKKIISQLDNELVKKVIQEIVKQEENHVVILTKILEELQDRPR